MSLFASNVIQKMGEDNGMFVLLEWWEQMLNYGCLSLHFTLLDMALIGKQRAMQRLAMGALGEVKEGMSIDDITAALDGQLEINNKGVSVVDLVTKSGQEIRTRWKWR